MLVKIDMNIWDLHILEGLTFYNNTNMTAMRSSEWCRNSISESGGAAPIRAVYIFSRVLLQWKLFENK